jgi:hypothetical protein
MYEREAEERERNKREIQKKVIKRRVRQRIVSSRPTIIGLCLTIILCRRKEYDKDGQC